MGLRHFAVKFNLGIGFMDIPSAHVFEALSEKGAPNYIAKIAWQWPVSSLGQSHCYLEAVLIGST